VACVSNVILLNLCLLQIVLNTVNSEFFALMSVINKEFNAPTIKPILLIHRFQVLQILW
jgi:hypothetical protein